MSIFFSYSIKLRYERKDDEKRVEGVRGMNVRDQRSKNAHLEHLVPLFVSGVRVPVVAVGHLSAG